MSKVLFAVILFSAALPAQALLSGVFSQPVIPVGAPALLQLSATEPISLTSGCGYVAVRENSPTGRVVRMPVICPRILITVGPGFTTQVTWPGTDQANAPVGPGTYYVEVSGRTMAGTLVTAFFPVRVDAIGFPVQPTLFASVSGQALPTFAATAGGRIDASISAPTEPFAAYFVFASATTNVGQTFGPLFFGLDADFVFSLSFPTPFPGLFDQFQGSLDGAGQASGIGVNIPAGVLPPGFPLALQAVLFGSSSIGFTNVATALAL